MTRGDSVLATVLAILILARLSQELGDSPASATPPDVTPRPPEATRARAGGMNVFSGGSAVGEER